MSTFVFDLDGTLVAPEGVIHNKNIEFLKKLYKKGHTIILASGRMYISMKRIIKRYVPFLIGKVPFIAYNGSYVVNENEKLLFQHGIEKNLSKKIIDFLKNEGFHRQIYLNDKLFTDQDNKEIKMYSEHASVDYKVVENLKKTIDEAKKPPIKILTISEQPYINEIKEKLIKKFGDRVDFVMSFHIFLDIITNKTSKGKALKELENIYSFNIEDTFIFGDSENDISMLKMSKNSFAMEDSNNDVKNAASNIAGPAKDAGVANELEKILSGGV